MKRSPARIFAPLALVACAVAVLAIVNTNNKSGSKGSTSTSTPTQTSTVSTTAKQGSKKTRRTYVVKNGDVLSAISIRTGVPLDTIIRLNPNVDAQSLHAGQKLKLAP